MTPRAWHSIFLTSLLLLNLFRLPGWAQEPQARLQIMIVEGEGAINNIKQRVNREPIVQVEDENHRPVAGAAVVFSLPSQGPSGVFPNGSQTLTTITDSQGRAVATGIRPNNQVGQLQIRVTASFQGQTASATITQINALGAAQTTGMSGTAKALIIVGIIGAAAAGGAIAATRGGGTSSTAGTPGAIVITPGTPTVGAPH
jgi:hypothetical protein